MGNQLRQVLRMYTTGWGFVVIAFWVVAHGSIFVVPLSLGAPSSVPDAKGLGPIVFLPLYGTLLACAMVAFVLKYQFANARARLLPGFAAPHLVVAGAVMAAAVAGSTWTIASAGHVSGLAVAALVLVATSAMVCFSYLTPLTFFIVLSLFAPAHIIWGQQGYLGSVITHGSPAISITELCIGLASLAVLGVRLSMLHEEMPEYCWRTLFSTADVTSQGAKQNSPPGLLGRLYDIASRLVFRRLPAWAPLRRLLLRRLSGGFVALLFAPWQFGQLVLFVLIQSSGSTTVSPGFDVGLSLFGFSLFPILLASAPLCVSLHVHRSHLPRESLYPLSRTEIVGDLARSIACDTAILAASHCAGFLVGLALFPIRGWLATRVLPYLALTLVQYAAVYCGILWAGSFRRSWVVWLELPSLSILSTALVGVALSSPDWFSSPVNQAVAVTAMVATVVLLYRAALVRWCRVELG